MYRAALVLALLMAGPAEADGFRSFDGHGGPVMGVDVSEDGRQVLTASFDYSVGLWAAGSEAAEPVWLEGHRAAVNRVAFLGDTRAISGGDDFAIIVWDLATGAALMRLEGHKGKVMGLAVSPDGTRLASASWDGSIGIWSLEDGALIAMLDDHSGNVNDVAWARGGAALYSAGYDGTILEWDMATLQPVRTLVRHGFGVNVLCLDEDRGWLAYGALDGGTRAVDLATGADLADLTLDRRPILAIAKSPDGGQIAVGDGEGYIMVVDTSDWTIARDFRAAVNGPIWALAYTGTGAGVIAGGIADEAFLWPLEGGDSAPRMAEIRREFHTDPGQVSNGERQFLRKCSICHTLGPDGERRAGPSLYGVFGREAGTLPGYSYSHAMKGIGIVWSDDTIDKLFELGPDHYTPGSKMPMQQIASAQDRADLIAFLKRETAPNNGD